MIRQLLSQSGNHAIGDRDNGSFPTSTSTGIPGFAHFSLTQIQLSEACLVVLFMLFLLIEAITVKQVWKLFKPPVHSQFSVSFTGEKTRAFFIIFLSIANLIRTLSLLCLFLDPASYYQPLLVPRIAVAPPSDPSIWTHSLLQGFPAVLYLSAYSIIILFWAQVYITARYVNASGLRPCFGFLNVAVYLVLLVVALLTRLLHAYFEFRLYMALLVGVLYTMSAVAFCFFGFRVAFQFSGDSVDRDQDARKAAVVRRILGLSIFCPLLFQLRGLFDLCIGLQLFPFQEHWGSQLSITWEILIIFLSEWVPATLILFSFFPPSNQTTKRYRAMNQNLTSPLLGNNSQTRTLFVNNSQNNGLMNFAPDNVYPLDGAAPGYRHWNK